MGIWSPMMNTKLFAAIVLFGSAFATACGATSTPGDAGAEEAGGGSSGDAASPDASAVDASAADVMIHDADSGGWHPTK